VKIHFLRKRFPLLLLLAAAWAFAPAYARAQSSGPTIDTCSSGTVDYSNDIEETVCITGDSTGLYATVEVDDDGYEDWGWSDLYVPEVGAQAYIYDGNTLVYTSSDSQGSPDVYSSGFVVPHVSDLYTLYGSADECFDYWDDGGCDGWGIGVGGMYITAQVTPSLVLSSSNAPSLYGTSVTFMGTISPGATGTVTFYDWGTPIGTGTISGTTATFTTSALAMGAHSITANWPGNSTYGALAASPITQIVYQPGPIQLPASGAINTVAGNGVGWYSGDGGAALAAELYMPTGVAVDSAGNLYIADEYNHRIRKVTASTGVISTVAGTGVPGFSGDGGAATSAKLYYPTGVAVDSAGNLYIADFDNDRIRKVAASTGIITTVAGNGTWGYTGDGGTATSAEIDGGYSVAADASGNIYIADMYNARVRKVTASTGQISTVAGSATAGFAGDGGSATIAKLFYPAGVVLDTSGDIYIADMNNGRVRKVTASNGIISTVAGGGTSIADGVAATSAAIYPVRIALDSSGNLYLSDTSTQRVRKVNASTGLITTVAGDGTAGYTGDGGPATSAELDDPYGLAVDAAGNLYMADMYNNRIRALGGSQTVPMLTFTAIPTKSYGVAPFAVSASSNSPGAITYSVTSGPASISGSTVTITGTGVVVLNASQAAAAGYSAGTTSTSFLVNPTIPNLNFTSIPTQTYGVAPFTVSATSNSPAAITYSVVSGPATLSGSILTIISGGTIVVSASQAATADYTAAAATTSFAVTVNTGSGGTPPPIYYYYMPTGTGYAANGNILNYTDSVNGTWSMPSGGTDGYDNLNRLSAAVQAPVSGNAQYFCWAYDAFGNRVDQMTASQAFPSTPGTPCAPAASATLLTNNWATYDDSSSNPNNHTNRILTTSAPGMTATVQYDGAGNVLNDGSNQYLYDAEGRLCASQSMIGGVVTGYLYDAEGNRVAKGTLASFSCSSSFAASSDYVLGPNNEQLTETDGSGNWKHTNVFAGGTLIATYDALGLHFQLGDWLGTKRVQTNYSGNTEESCVSMPFGDMQVCTGSDDSTEHHFTGKERDAESGLDYFGARYYGSSMGRFMSPDDDGGHLEDPQTLNKYAYVGNNPLSRTDPDGHDFWQSCDKASTTCGSQQIGTNKDGSAINHLVQGTTTNGQFSATVITSASLGAAGSGNSATVNGTGVEITSKTGTAQGIFINGTQSADIKGDANSAGWSQFSFHIGSNDAAHGVLTDGTATYTGGGGHDGMVNAINALTVNGHGPFTYTEESTRYRNPFHPEAQFNIRFSTGDHPELFNYGPSPHFPVPYSGTTSGFHVDSKTGPSHLSCAAAGVGCF
jgi:RHS repeat-associated protein